MLFHDKNSISAFSFRDIILKFLIVVPPFATKNVNIIENIYEYYSSILCYTIKLYVYCRVVFEASEKDSMMDRKAFPILLPLFISRINSATHCQWP